MARPHSSIRCIYPEFGATIGYAVTSIYGLPDPNFYGRMNFMDVIDALDAAQKPTILVMQQKWPPELHRKAELAGEIMVGSMMAVGCVGLVSNGPSRDIDAIRRLRFQLLLGGVTAGHGDGGADHQRAGICRWHGRGARGTRPYGRERRDGRERVAKLPAQHAKAVLDNVTAMLAEETTRLAVIRSATTTAAVRSANAGTACTPKKD